jgi:hypothetical protein
MEVEFKLFGSFTLSEFMKILVGGLVALGFFLSPLPVLVKIPFMGVSVLTGLALAMVENLGAWLRGFVKALFVSPRYVWVKSSQTPDVLKSKNPNTSKPGQNVASATKASRVDITELPLEQLFVSRERVDNTQNQEGKNEEDISSPSVDRVYEEVFGKDIFKDTTIGVMPQVINASTSQAPAQTPLPSTQIAATTPTNYAEEIEKLKFELSRLSRDENYAEKEASIMSRINDLYHAMKVQQNGGVEVQNHNLNPMTNPQNFLQTKREIVNGKIVFGIVVGKKDEPLENVNINLINTTTGETFSIVTGRDGKFNTGKPVSNGTYSITLEDSKNKFHTYSIVVGDQNLPAYKFRAK